MLKYLVCLIFTAFSRLFWLAKMASTSSWSCSPHAAVCYSMEQAMSMVMDDQSLNVLAGKSDNGSVWNVLCWLYHEWIVNKCKNTKHAFHQLYDIKIRQKHTATVNQLSTNCAGMLHCRSLPAYFKLLYLLIHSSSLIDPHIDLKPIAWSIKWVCLF